MSKINDLFNDQEGHIHQHTIDMFYPYFDSLVDLCDDAKFYPTISYMMYQIVFSTPYMAKSYTYYESPKLWKRIVKSIMNDDDYITFENVQISKNILVAIHYITFVIPQPSLCLYT